MIVVVVNRLANSVLTTFSAFIHPLMSYTPLSMSQFQLTLLERWGMTYIYVGQVTSQSEGGCMESYNRLHSHLCVRKLEPLEEKSAQRSALTL